MAKTKLKQSTTEKEKLAKEAAELYQHKLETIIRQTRHELQCNARLGFSCSCGREEAMSLMRNAREEFYNVC